MIIEVKKKNQPLFNCQTAKKAISNIVHVRKEIIPKKLKIKESKIMYQIVRRLLARLRHREKARSHLPVTNTLKLVTSQIVNSSTWGSFFTPPLLYQEYILGGLLVKFNITLARLADFLSL